MVMPLNRARLNLITSGDPALEGELFEFYRETADRCIETMESHHEKGGDMWHSAAHELKGAAGNLGTPEVHDLCTPAPTAETLEARRKLVEELKGAYKRLEPYLRPEPKLGN